MKIKLLPLLLMLCLLAVGCAETVDNSSALSSVPSDISENTSDSDVSEPSDEPSWDTTPRELDYTKNGFSGEFRNLRMPTDSDSDTMTLVATSNEEMRDILAATERGMTYEEFIDKYGENFFDTKALILSDCTMPSMSIVVELESVHIDESGITLSISTKTPLVCLDATVPYIMTVEVNKSDIGGCKTAKTIIEERVYPVSGTIGEYDETPRDIEFTPYVFNYKVNHYLNNFKSFDKSDKFKAFIYSDIYINPSYGEIEDYGKSGDDLDKYCKKGKTHFDDKVIIAVYIASADGRSNFEISSLRADENGITMTIKHTLAEESETDKVYSVVVAEVEKELLAGCELFKVVLDESEAPLTVPEGFLAEPTIEKPPYTPIDGRDFEITVIDKITKKPINNATVLVGEYYGPLEEPVEYSTDENGKVTVTVGMSEKEAPWAQICVYIEEYYSYCLIYPKSDCDSYTVMLHKYLSEYE